MNFHIFTLFPEMFPGSLAHSLQGKALNKGLMKINCINIRNYASDKHQTVDDTPYGGGAGMVMKADVIDKAISSHIQNLENEPNNLIKNSLAKPLIIYFSPRGFVLKQATIDLITHAYRNGTKISLKDFAAASGISHENNLEDDSSFSTQDIFILCGRYEGVDQRVIDKYSMIEISIGDYILSGGELAAMVFMDSISRKIPTVIGNEETHSQESFAMGEYKNLLEYPIYTKPRIWEEKEVPSVLLEGNHKAIDNWRLDKAREITKERRPDLI